MGAQHQIVGGALGPEIGQHGELADALASLHPMAQHLGAGLVDRVERAAAPGLVAAHRSGAACRRGRRPDRRRQITSVASSNGWTSRAPTLARATGSPDSTMARHSASRIAAGVAPATAPSISVATKPSRGAGLLMEAS